MEMCRACLSTNDIMPMDVIIVSNYNVLTSLNLVLTNDVPLYTCSTCLEAIKFCTDFRQKCIVSDLMLKDLFANDELKCEATDDKHRKIKTEIKLELDEELGPIVMKNDCSNFNDYENNTYKPNSEINNSETENENEWVSKNTLSSRKKRKVKKEPMKKKVLPHRKTKVEAEKCEKGDGTLKYCGICSKKFDNTGTLVKHFEFHQLDKSCGLCVERFIDFTHVLAHRIEHVPEGQKTCHLCSRKFLSPNSLEFHYLKKHNLRGEGGKVVCKMCLVPFLTPKKLSLHLKSVHSETKYICDTCGKGYRIKHSLMNHIKIHSDQKTYKCDMCNFSCKLPGGLSSHKMRKHTVGRVYCQPCGRVFPGKDLLDKHVCKHTHGLVCTFCGIYVAKSSMLRRHLLSHTAEPQFKCERCPATFKSSSSYKAHVNRHDGYKPFLCQYCPMRFYSQSVLVKHRRTHTGEKPYVCKICSKAFTGNNNLKVHMKVHGQNLVVKRTTKSEDNIV